jgi:hypothetical protein
MASAPRCGSRRHASSGVRSGSGSSNLTAALRTHPAPAVSSLSGRFHRSAFHFRELSCSWRAKIAFPRVVTHRASLPRDSRPASHAGPRSGRQNQGGSLRFAAQHRRGQGSTFCGSPKPHWTHALGVGVFERAAPLVLWEASQASLGRHHSERGPHFPLKTIARPPCHP